MGTIYQHFSKITLDREERNSNRFLTRVSKRGQHFSVLGDCLFKSVTQITDDSYIFIELHQHGMTMKQEALSSHHIQDITKSTYSFLCDSHYAVKA